MDRLPGCLWAPLEFYSAELLSVCGVHSNRTDSSTVTWLVSANYLLSLQLMNLLVVIHGVVCVACVSCQSQSRSRSNKFILVTLWTIPAHVSLVTIVASHSPPPGEMISQLVVSFTGSDYVYKLSNLCVCVCVCVGVYMYMCECVCTCVCW